MSFFPIYVESDVHTAVTMNSSILWCITSNVQMKLNRCFDGTYRLHFQGPRLRQIRRQHKRGNIAAFLLGLFFDSKDAGDMSRRPLTFNEPQCVTCIPEDRTLLTRISESLKPHELSCSLTPSTLLLNTLSFRN
jgi:hypothetical protein